MLSLTPALQGRATRLVDLVKKHPGLIAIFGFLSGMASFFLVERKESLAQVIALIMLAGWAWLLLENWLRAGIFKRFGFEMPPAVMRFATQLIHQESLFFTLPFFLAVTTWDHGQAGFTLLLVGCALVSLVDPIYYNWLAPRRSLFVAFHALTLFAVLLVVIPLILHLSTSQSLWLALILALLFSLPSLGGLVPNGYWWRIPVLVLMLSAMALGTWKAREWIPPAALRVTGITLSHHVDREKREPGESINRISAQSLRQEGLYAWTSVRVPRGLREKIHHVWLMDGKEVDRITLDINGGRDEGYRAWTHKRNFPANPVGRWQVRVVTDSGQLVGLTRFTVTESPPEETTFTETLAAPEQTAEVLLEDVEFGLDFEVEITPE
ncbi:DUF5924 family protein [Marinimicrobium sp. ABcell2]|uniref:DUF5924 family protein n=1 Tax=Marinimicrobium sp. ABcell2 TaxID=3069751 RepID=UPI0027B4A877|nr:DUF5924 family protein [Marinimicrobium sp. ABcell2]MDQ2077976.1 DUF5924 family protein [Marinimicrobium sp. ABcell2]